jgi:hypothetical protein
VVETARPSHAPCAGLLADGCGCSPSVSLTKTRRRGLSSVGIYDQAIVQALGRARGLNRTARNPVEIWACANVPLPMPVDSITRWRPASRLAKMLLAGFVPLNAADMARFYPELFHERGSARGSVATAA